LESGRSQGVFDFPGTARREARLFFSALQGALLVKRSNGDINQLEDVINALKSGIVQKYHSD